MLEVNADPHRRPGWPRALLFDFDGVIVNSEPFHCAATCAVMREWGMALDEPTYYRELIGFDDRGGFAHLFAMNGRAFDEATCRAVVAAKSKRVLEFVRVGPVQVLPGAAELIRSCARERLLAICSGALRSEIEAMLDVIGLREAFPVIVAGGEVEVGKPDPSGYLRTLDLLREQHGVRLEPRDCVVIEDAPRVASAVRAIGFPVLGVLTSHGREKWTSYDWLAPSLNGADLRGAGFPLQPL